MKAYSIEQLHELFKDETNIRPYLEELYKEAYFIQNKLNAFITINTNNSINSNKSILSNIPYVLKDNFNTKGILTSAGSYMLSDYIPIYNATVVDKLSDCLMIGKSNMDEFGMGATNKSSYKGVVRNPYDINRIAGGSSGGSSAIVASGLVPFSIASDTGDSIRKPAGYCGIVGFKPTYGRISRYGLIPYASSLDTVGILTRSVRDNAIVLENVAGRDDKDMTSSNKVVGHYLDDLDSNIKDVKIGIFRSIVDDITDQDIINNFNDVVNICKSLSNNVEDVYLDKEILESILPTYVILANSEATSNLACLDGIKYGKRVNSDNIEDLMINSRTVGFNSHIKYRLILGSLALSKEHQDKMFRKAQKVRRVIVDAYMKLFEKYDVIIAPNSNCIAPKIDDDSFNDSISGNYLVLSNFAGNPSLTIPCGIVNKMPVAINISGRMFDEQMVLNVAYAIECKLKKD